MSHCQQHWAFSRVQAFRLVEAASALVSRMGPIGPILPATESQARELARLEEPEQQIAAWQAVVERVDGDARKVAGLPST